MLYEVAWRERPLAGGLVSAEALTGPAAVSEDTSPFADYLWSEGVAMEDRAMLLNDLERLSRSYALSALEELGWKRRRGEAVDPETLRDVLGIEPEHTRLVGRLLRLVRDAGLLSGPDDEGRYVVEVDAGGPLGDEALADSEAFADRVAERHPHGINELGLVRRSGIALAGGLRGTVDILEVLFRSEGPGVTEYYFAAPASRASNRLLADAVARRGEGLAGGSTPAGDRGRRGHGFGHVGGVVGTPGHLRLHVHRHLGRVFCGSRDPVCRFADTDGVPTAGH